MGKALHAAYGFGSFVEYDFAPASDVWLRWRQSFNANALTDFFQGELFLSTGAPVLVDTVTVDSTDPAAPRLSTTHAINGPFGPTLVAGHWYTIGLHLTISAGVLTTELYLDAVNLGPVDNGGFTSAAIESLFVGGLGGGAPGDEVWVDDITLGTTGFGSTDIFATGFETGVFVPPFTTDDSTDDGLFEIVDAPAFTTVRTRLEGPPPWRLIVTNLAGATLTILDKRSKERAFLFQMNGPATHTGLVPSDDPEINIPTGGNAFVSHNVRLVYGLRRERRSGTSDDPWEPRYGGILEVTEDVAADAPTTRYVAYDSWGLLMARPALNPDGTFPRREGVRYKDARASDMAVELLANTVAIHGDVYIDASDSGLVETTDVIDGLTVFDQGLSVGEAWQQLCDTGTIDIILRPIYDPIGRPGKLCELVIRKPTTFTVRHHAVFGWDRAGRSVTELSRLIDGTRLADKVKVYAGQGGQADSVPVQTDATAVSKYGQYWAQIFSVVRQGQSGLAALYALAQLELRKNGERTITFTPAPERGPEAFTDYQLGDYVPLWASRAFREPLGIDFDTYDPDFPGASGYQRVFAIPIELDDNGVERVNGILTTSNTMSG
jgi:hypothetical protein